MATLEKLKTGLFHILEQATDENCRIKKGVALVDLVDQINEFLAENGACFRIGELSSNPYRDTDFHRAVAFDEGKYSVFHTIFTLREILNNG